jgi:uncharacterized protein (TIGR02147 family)
MGQQYQDFLLKEFSQRRSRNPNYSLRAFARDLGMPASKLSQNLRGLCGISVAKAESIAVKIQMPLEDKQIFLALVEAAHARSQIARDQAAQKLQRLNARELDELEADKFATVRDWYHLAILELMETKNFRPDIQWIAGRLELAEEIVRQALGRLVDCGLLTLSQEGWKSDRKHFAVSGGIPSGTVREHHRQIIAKASAALETVPLESREVSSQTFAVAQSLLPELKQLIRDFHRQVAKLSDQGSKDDVYALSIQLFPLVGKES